jgi:hypothetical protein
MKELVKIYFPSYGKIGTTDEILKLSLGEMFIIVF